jgi:AcrR family transcriptional regulator
MPMNASRPDPVPAPPAPAPARRGYGGRSAEALAAERRQRLLDTALELFGTQGYAATPTEKLCAAAKVTTRHFYEHFRDREALLLAVFEQVMAGTQARVMEVLLKADRPPAERFLAALDAFLDAQLEDPRRARLTTSEVLGVSTCVEAGRNAVISGFAQLVEGYADALAASGELPVRNYRVLAFGMVGAMHELQMAWLNPDNRLDLDTLKAEMHFLVRALLTGARASAA